MEPNETQTTLGGPEHQDGKGDKEVLPTDANGGATMTLNDVVSRLDKFGKEFEGQRSLIQKWGQEQGEFRKEFTGIRDMISGIKSPPDSDDDAYGDIVTGKQLSSLLEQNNQAVLSTLLGALGQTQQQASLMQTYGLDEEGLSAVQEYAQKNGITDLEYAHFQMNKGQILSGQNKTKQLLGEKKNKGDTVPPAGGNGTDLDTPGRLLAQKRFDEFNQWAEKNPESYRKWLRRKEGIK